MLSLQDWEMAFWLEEAKNELTELQKEVVCHPPPPHPSRCLFSVQQQHSISLSLSLEATSIIRYMSLSDITFATNNSPKRNYTSSKDSSAFTKRSSWRVEWLRWMHSIEIPKQHWNACERFPLFFFSLYMSLLFLCSFRS